MGLYDTVICDYPVVGGLPTWISKHPFQTKDLECQMKRYTISVDGSFSEAQWTGILNFYSDNVVGSGPGIYTEYGEAAEYLDCTAKIVDGKVVSDIQISRSSHKAWPSSKMRILSSPTNEELNKIKERRAELLLGKRLYVLWGGEDIGYWGNVVAENDRQLCIQLEDDSKFHRRGDFELIDRFNRDHIFWDSDTEALSEKEKRQEQWIREKEEFEIFRKS